MENLPSSYIDLPYTLIESSFASDRFGLAHIVGCFISVNRVLHLLRGDSNTCTDEYPQILTPENSPSQSNLALTPEPPGWVSSLKTSLTEQKVAQGFPGRWGLVFFLYFTLHCAGWTFCRQPQRFTFPCRGETASPCRGIAPPPLPMSIWSAQWGPRASTL